MIYSIARLKWGAVVEDYESEIVSLACRNLKLLRYL